MNRKSTLPLVVLIFAIVGLLVVGGLLLIMYGSQQATEEPAIVATNEVVAAATTAPTPVPTSGGANLLPPAITVFPTSTPAPTSTPTNTPLPTDTPLATDTSVPTDTPVPTAVPIFVPTNTPKPAATNTPGPTNTPAPPQGANGLTATHFALQARSDFRVNQPVWFEFNVANSTGSPVPFGTLGVMPKKDGTDRLSWYQNSWGGNNDVIEPTGLSWEDNIRLPETGNYTLRLVICFQDINTCRNGGGTWFTLSQEISITISN